MTRKRFCYYNENDFKYLKDKTKEELIDEVKDAYINQLNYWMDSLEKYMNLMDERNQTLNKLNQRIDKAIEFLNDENITFPSAKEWRDYLKSILRGESNE